MELFKDAVLDELAGEANVAQFVSFDPSLSQRFSRVRGYAPNYLFQRVDEAIEALLSAASDRSVNVRSFHPEDFKSRAFVYGLTSSSDVCGEISRLSRQGLYTIVNETIDVHDGGVSGVAFAGVCEFAPDDTPRCVEGGATVALPLNVAIALLRAVYDFTPALHFGSDYRVEFSVHPLRRGFHHDHTIIWEREEIGPMELRAEITWPNAFSRLIGDKAFGLLLADAMGLPVPRAMVVSRRIAPFSIGRPTGTAEKWIRTCPREQVPGYFTTKIGWLDPFTLMQEEDPKGTALSSLLCQDSVEAQYAGALVMSPEGEIEIEGVPGYGDEFMQGRAEPVELPDEVEASVRSVADQAQSQLGPVRLEWAYDGKRTWVLQLHRGSVPSVGRVIYPGQAESYERFDVNRGIDALRKWIRSNEGSGRGVAVVGRVGITSHFGDLLRRARIPSYVEDEVSLEAAARAEGPAS